ncbi:MAG: hypothetical protein IPO77_14845 [Acidobacteria bacterium]|nr:hypothetical protein [Acidobacteriota bacterium]
MIFTKRIGLMPISFGGLIAAQRLIYAAIKQITGLALAADAFMDATA